MTVYITWLSVDKKITLSLITLLRFSRRKTMQTDLFLNAGRRHQQVGQWCFPTVHEWPLKARALLQTRSIFHVIVLQLHAIIMAASRNTDMTEAIEKSSSRNTARNPKPSVIYSCYGITIRTNTKRYTTQKKDTSLQWWAEKFHHLCTSGFLLRDAVEYAKWDPSKKTHKYSKRV